MDHRRHPEADQSADSIGPGPRPDAGGGIACQNNRPEGIAIAVEAAGHANQTADITCPIAGDDATAGITLDDGPSLQGVRRAGDKRIGRIKIKVGGPHQTTDAGGWDSVEIGIVADGDRGIGKALRNQGADIGVSSGQATDIVSSIAAADAAQGIALQDGAVILADQTADAVDRGSEGDSGRRPDIVDDAAVGPRQQPDIGDIGAGRHVARQGEISHHATAADDAEQPEIAVAGVVDGQPGNIVSQPLQRAGEIDGTSVVQANGRDAAGGDVAGQGVESGAAHRLKIVDQGVAMPTDHQPA